MSENIIEAQCPSVYISQLVLSDGTTVDFCLSDTVIIVGPNSAGKSELLRGIRDKMIDRAKNNAVVQSLALAKNCSWEDFRATLDTWTINSKTDTNYYTTAGVTLHISNIENAWRADPNSLGIVARWFCHYVSGAERLQLCEPPESISLTTSSPIHPIHSLQRDDRLEEMVSRQFKMAFGQDLIVHHSDGKKVPLYVGIRPDIHLGEDRISRTYLDRLEQLTQLVNEGDGMKSFAGVLLATMTGGESVFLVDEPEAFLHPPQAKLLGATIAKDLSKRQVFMATHSADILRGALNVNSNTVKVIRIIRDGHINRVSLLDNEGIRKLWGDPLLRYSNIFDGLFHEQVVVCESDGDCRFYSAILDALYDGTQKRPDILFTHCGGKHRISVVAQALRAVGVSVKVVADFDILSAEQPLRALYESMDGTWSNIQKIWNTVNKAVADKRPQLETSDLIRDFGRIVTQDTPSQLPEDKRVELHKLLKKTSAWSEAKRTGKAFVPKGDPARYCEDLLYELRTSGIHVVEVGELEGFIPTIGGHGPDWVRQALERNLVVDPELQSAREFVKILVQN